MKVFTGFLLLTRTVDGSFFQARIKTPKTHQFSQQGSCCRIIKFFYGLLRNKPCQLILTADVINSKIPQIR